ncbi:MAG: hypothetical protein M3O62_02665 [Pseudomonadota bacterium]|nr:hypothetical protein [Pseudomonadota bacterium]
MRPEEAFVGESLIQYLGGPHRASISDGEDPPDLYLNVEGERIGVEVTRLSQFTFEPDGSLGNRVTQDSFALRLIDMLDDQIGPILPGDISLLVGLWVPVEDPRKFRSALTTWVTQVAMTPRDGFKEERIIAGDRVRLSVIPRRSSGKKIVGYVSNRNSSADMGLNARLLLGDRIQTKREACASLPGRLWLALLNDYWLADEGTYAAASRQLQIVHPFERILLVSDRGTVSDLIVGTEQVVAANHDL